MWLNSSTTLLDHYTEHQRIQELEKELWRARRDNEILKKAAAFFIRDNHGLK